MSKIDELIENIKASEAVDKLEDIKDASAAKIKAVFTRKQIEDIIDEKEDERKAKSWIVALAIIGIIAIGCMVGYFIYRKNKPDYLDDFDDDLDEDDSIDEDDDIFEEE